MSKWIGMCVAVLAAAVITGCSMPVEGAPGDRDDEGATSQDGGATTPADTGVETPPSTEAVDEPDGSAASGVVRIGEGVYAYEDGLTVEVTGLAPYTPGDFAIGADSADSAITFSVTITNETAEPVDLAIPTVNVNAGAAGNVADQIFHGDLGGGFTGAVLPGKSATVAYAFAVNAADQGELVIEIEPGFLDYDPAYFEGSLS